MIKQIKICDKYISKYGMKLISLKDSDADGYSDVEFITIRSNLVNDLP